MYYNEKMLQFAKLFDHTLLRPDATIPDFYAFCSDCKRYRFRMAAVNPAIVSYCRSLLKDSDVRIGAAVGFPLGQTTLQTKIFETKDAIQQGADDIDYVINITSLKAGDYSYLEKEMDLIVSICKKKHVVSKVIFENCYLSPSEIVKMSEIAMKIRPDYIKTSTGFGLYGARAQDVELMKSVVGNTVKIKAAGGISSLKDCLDLIHSGADCLGCSHSVDIMAEYKEYLHALEK